jgi:3-dehydroquinate dehydratase-2
MKILLINAVNLKNIGSREPEIYGNDNFNEFLVSLRTKYAVAIDYFQSDEEGKIAEKIQNSVSENYDGIVMNAGAYSHSSIAIRDAIAASNTKVVLVHISNVYKREIFRHYEIIAPVCAGIITGFGLRSYELGLLFFVNTGSNGFNLH